MELNESPFSFRKLKKKLNERLFDKVAHNLSLLVSPKATSNFFIYFPFPAVGRHNIKSVVHLGCLSTSDSSLNSGKETCTSQPT